MAATIPSGVAPLKFGKFKPYYSPAEMLQLGVFGGTSLYLGSMRDKLGSRIYNILKKDLPQSQYDLSVYDSQVNYFKVGVPARDRMVNLPIDAKSFNSSWFEWYCIYYYDTRRIPKFVSDSRIAQWKDELTTFSYYVENTVYSGPSNRYTDNTFCPTWKQYMLEMGWDPTIKP